MHFFITGHTGFKGAWLTLLLRERGHSVSGYSLDEEVDSLFQLAVLEEDLQHDFRGDVRDIKSLKKAIELADPEVVIHLAAQSLVRRSHREPEFTLESNTLGTINILSAISSTSRIRAALIVTTDKVYANSKNNIPCKEEDVLGGIDPYSCSKCLADLYTQNWISFTKHQPIGIARAGNVIGGGDVCKERLVPEIYNAIKSGVDVQLRYPDAVRPWQHVLDCLNGYLTIVDHLLSTAQSGIWNIGPKNGNNKTVKNLCELLLQMNAPQLGWEASGGNVLVESHYLSLDSSKAQRELGWESILNFEESVFWTSDWFLNTERDSQFRRKSISQIKDFEEKRCSNLNRTKA